MIKEFGKSINVNLDTMEIETNFSTLTGMNVYFLRNAINILLRYEWMCDVYDNDAETLWNIACNSFNYEDDDEENYRELEAIEWAADCDMIELKRK